MRCRPNSSSPATIPSPGSRLIRSSSARLKSYQLSQNFKLKLLRARLLQKLGPEQANWLFPSAKPGEPITTLPGDRRQAREATTTSKMSSAR